MHIGGVLVFDPLPGGGSRRARWVPVCTLQEWMGHRDIETTQRPDFTPRTRDAELVAAAFSRAAVAYDMPERTPNPSR